VLAIACIAWFVILCFIATLRLNAFSVADEAGYLLPILYGFDAEKYHRWSILGAYPSYLYFWVYSLLPPDGLPASAKMLNAGFIAATAIPAYAVARRYLTIPVAGAFAAVVVLSPISLFVWYVMPEPMYFFGFWLVVAVLLSTLDKSPLLSAIAGGALIGALSLVKPHALALTLGACLFFILRDRFRAHAAFAAVSLFLAYYVVRIVLGYLLTGEWTWSVSGENYGGMLFGHHIDLSATASNAMGHVSAVVTLIAVPLAVTLVLVVPRRAIQTEEAKNLAIQRLLDLGLLACCILTAMMAMTIYFSQSVYQISPEVERFTRLHGRYYVYVLPLFVLVTIGLWQNGIDLSQMLPRFAVMVLCGAMVVAAAVIVFKFEISSIDFPDLTLARRLPFAAAALFFAVFILSYAGWGRIGTNLIIGATIWWAAIGLATTAALIIRNKTLVLNGPIDAAFFDPGDRSGLRSLVGRNDGIIIGPLTSAGDVHRTMFYLRSLSAGRLVTSGAEITDDDLPKEASWAVLLPGVRYLGSSQVTHDGALAIIRR
jgi:phosphoglycerol transferase